MVTITYVHTYHCTVCTTYSTFVHTDMYAMHIKVIPTGHMHVHVTHLRSCTFLSDIRMYCTCIRTVCVSNHTSMCSMKGVTILSTFMSKFTWLLHLRMCVCVCTLKDSGFE